MDSSTTHAGAPVNVHPLFGTWPTEGATFETANKIRYEFDNLLKTITAAVPKGNERYLSIVKSDLEKACMFAIKAIAHPVGNG